MEGEKKEKRDVTERERERIGGEGENMLQFQTMWRDNSRVSVAWQL